MLFTGVRMLDRDARVNRHLKSNRQTLKKGLPSNSEGSNGDITIREVSGVTKQYVKNNGKWNSISGETAAVAKTIVVTGTSGVSSASSGASGSDHSGLDNLSSDDHAQYLHNTIARTVSAGHAFTGTPSFTGIDINGGDIASGTTINKSPVVNFNSGDVQGSLTLTNLASGTGSLTIQPNSVALSTDTTGNYMVNVTGNSQVSVSHSQGEGSTAALSIADDSIGDTQLAYNTGQHLTTSSAVTFATVNTGQGDNELYDMNQNVLTSSDVTFNDIIVAGDDISSDPFSSGFTGQGWKIDNTGHLSVGSATIRGTLSVFELLIQQIRATNGAIFVSSSAKVESASGLSASDDDGTITFEDPSNNNLCPFAANDLIMMQRVNPGSLVAGNAAGGATNVIKKLLYKVSSVNGKTITVENGGYNNTTSPSAGDDFVRIGNTSNSARQGIIYLTSDDTNSPFIDIKADIDSYSDWTGSTPKVRLGKLDGITDSDLGGSLSGFGLYSNNIFLKGKIVANSGTIGGINMESNKLYVGTGTYNNSNTAFYLNDSGSFSLKDKLSWNGTTLTVNGNITIANASSVRSDLNVADGSTSNRSDSATDTAVNSAAKTGGSVGGWSLSSSAITGSNIVMSSSGSIAVSNGYSLNNDGSASFSNGNITFATNGDITSTTYLVERTRLFGGGEDGVVRIHTQAGDGNSGSTNQDSWYAVDNADGTRVLLNQGAVSGNGAHWYQLGDIYATDFTVRSGTVLYPRGFRIFCKGTLTVESGAAIYTHGSTATNQNGAAGGIGANLSAGTAGKNGGNGGEGTEGVENKEDMVEELVVLGV